MIKVNKKEKKNKDALLEIGVEELPTSYIDPALEQIKNIAAKSFLDAGLKYAGLEVFATPRKLILFIENLDDKSQTKQEEILGPSLKSAKDAHGNFTQSAKGFASKYGISPEELQSKNTQRGDYFFFARMTKGEKTEKLLPSIFTQIIKGISFPKTMIWEESGFRFARPIRSILALYDAKIIKFRIADVLSSNWTLGLRAQKNQKIPIKTPREYFIKLKNKSVIVNQNERKEAARKSIEAAAETVGKIVRDDDLLNEVNYLVEYPSAVLCEFDKKYLELPKEVLTVCMRKNQKCFSVNDKKGKFTNYFIGVRNGLSQYQDIVRSGYERVVAARLTDAEFFYRNDIKKGLDANIEKLKGLTFHNDIGSIYEKVERIEKLSNFLAERFFNNIDKNTISRAVYLSKADLVSEMVFEYPELQGIMGRVYASKLGESKEVSQAIQEHYQPLSASGKLPSNDIALIISFADKMDSLCANFAIGLEPSGSADPYALRRAGIIIIRMMFEVFFAQDLNPLIDFSFDILPQKVKSHQKFESAKQRLERFFWQRIENILESEGFSLDAVKAVVNAAKISGFKSLGDIKPKLKALEAVKQKGDFVEIAELFKRINNITAQAKKQNIEFLESVDEALLSDISEKNLYESVKNLRSQIQKDIAARDYAEVFVKILQIKPQIDDFFKNVMVMTDDAGIKRNRITLLNLLKETFISFIDFAALQ